MVIATRDGLKIVSTYEGLQFVKGYPFSQSYKSDDVYGRCEGSHYLL